MKFIKIPKEFFKNPYYKNLSSNAKLLYGLLLDRRSLSESNNLTDDNGETVVYCTHKEAKELLCIGKDACDKAFNDLKTVGLLRVGFLGVGKTCMLYIKKPLRHVGNSVHTVSGIQYTNNTDYNKTELNKTDYNKELEDYFLNFFSDSFDKDGHCI